MWNSEAYRMEQVYLNEVTDHRVDGMISPPFRLKFATSFDIC